MGRLVCVRVVESNKGAHQYVQIDGARIGEIWRTRLTVKDAKGNECEKWQWFARPVGSIVALGEDGSSDRDKGFGSKDKAVDALVLATLPVPAVGIPGPLAQFPKESI